jgi:hypothetical protein
MVRTIAARVRKLRGRQTALDLAFEEWAELRAVLRRLPPTRPRGGTSPTG